jgi:P27 family predicted phage terminase small subunit
MGSSARVFWKRHAAALADLGLLTAADVDSFRVMCETWGACVDAAAAMHAAGLLRRDDTGALKKSGAWLMFDAAQKAYRAWVGEFGLSPRARGALSLPVGDDGEVDLATLLFQSVGGDA